MSAILPPSERLWWKHPLDRLEAVWIVIAFIWCMVMFFMMVFWHVYGKQNLATETYKTTPDKFTAATQAPQARLQRRRDSGNALMRGGLLALDDEHRHRRQCTDQTRPHAGLEVAEPPGLRNSTAGVPELPRTQGAAA